MYNNNLATGLYKWIVVKLDTIIDHFNFFYVWLCSGMILLFKYGLKKISNSLILYIEFFIHRQFILIIINIDKFNINI